MTSLGAFGISSRYLLNIHSHPLTWRDVHHYKALFLVSTDNMLMDIPKEKLTTIVEILKSRRLLSDHSEILEECLTTGGDCSTTTSISKYFNGLNCSFLITSAFIASKFVTKRIGITLCAISSGYASGYAIVCLSKLVLYGQLWMFHKSIITLLDDIDGFDACVRRNISYFRENSLFQSSHQSPSDIIVTTSKDLIAFTKSLAVIIESIQDVVINLEATATPSKVDNLFPPLENLSEYLEKLCTKPTVSALKDLYNVFLYVQSHLLTRISLFLIYNNRKSQSLPKGKCKLLSRIIKAEISKDNLRYEQLTSTTSNVHPNSIDHIATEPMRNLKSYSISAASKILAIANECRRIDGIVQNVNNEHKEELTGLMTSITQIENALHVCQSEYQRFVVAYCKVMNVKYDQCNDQDLHDENEFTVDPTLNLNDFKEIQADEEEFFTSTERTSDDESKELHKNRKCWDDELTERNIRIVKQRFKPVLAQLKGKIEPIAMPLRKRERNHLLSKGIDPSEFVDCNITNEGFKSCSDSDDNETEYVRRKKPNRSYDDMRKFLEGKPQISLIPMRSANEKFLNEDILE